MTIVKDMASAVRAYEALYKNQNKYFACDTEVAKIDIKTQGPVGNGEVSKIKGETVILQLWSVYFQAINEWSFYCACLRLHAYQFMGGPT